jgi:hypothetical protein
MSFDREIGLTYLDKFSGEVCETFNPGWRDDDIIFYSYTTSIRKVYPGFDGEGHPRFEEAWIVTSDVGLFVSF